MPINLAAVTSGMRSSLWESVTTDGFAGIHGLMSRARAAQCKRATTHPRLTGVLLVADQKKMGKVARRRRIRIGRVSCSMAD
jgi:hypothetical protein